MIKPKSAWLVVLFLVATACGAERAPNVIVILADDLGYGEVGCYGQTKIITPNIDRIAAEGVRLTQAYSGSPVCAPSRCVLLTGLHTGHAFVRANKEMGGWGPDEPEGQLPLPAGTMTLARALQGEGYATCAIGKWGLGGPDSTGHPNRQGFDHWYGYLCQRVAHNYYPTHLWRNGDKDMLPGNAHFKAHQKVTEAPDDWSVYRGATYAPDAMIDEAEGWVREHADKPFFLYYATPVPHVAIQVPDDSSAAYPESWDEAPYLGQKGYLPHPRPRAGYAGMVTRMDRDIGRLLDLLDELDLADYTIVIFTSDNGPTFNGGTDSTFFSSAGPLRGLKTQLYEGGIRVPFVARWPEHFPAGTVSHAPLAFQDLFPTIMTLAGAAPPDGVDGINCAAAWSGDDAANSTERVLYWEYRKGQVVRAGKWKALKPRGSDEIQLYDLIADVGETSDRAAEFPEVVQRMRELMSSERTASADFPIE